MTPRRHALPETLVGHGESVWFDSLDGVRLHGMWLRGRKSYPTIVLCHGYFKSIAEMLDLGVKLNERGYNAFLFDFRACGESGGRFTTVGHKESWDVQAAVRFARDRYERGPVGVLGVSMGAAAAITAAAETDEIAAVVADSSFADLQEVIRRRIPELARVRWISPLGWGCIFIGEKLSGRPIRRLRPVDHVGRIAPRPVLFVHGEMDTYIPVEHAEDLHRAAGEPKELWAVPGSDHAAVRFDHSEEYIRRVLAFFDEHLRGKRTPREEPLEAA